MAKLYLNGRLCYGEQIDLLVDQVDLQFDKMTEHVEPAVLATLKEAEARLESLEASKPTSWEELFPKSWDIFELVSQCWSPVRHLNSVMNSKELREAFEKMQQKIVAFFLRAQQSEVVFKALLDLRDGSEWSQLDATQKRIVEKRILDAELDGARLEGERREEFNSIVKELSEHSLKFNNNVLDATNAFAIDITEKTDVAGLSDSVLALCDCL